MIKLIVEGEQLDLFKNEVFAISKAVSKIGDINLRHGDVSINFKVPATAKNNQIFRYLYNLNNNNLGAFKRFEGVVLDGQSVVSVGYYQVLKTKPLKKEIELRFYGGNSDWFDLIKDRSINKTYENTSNNPNAKSYDLSYLNHTYVEETIKDSWDNEDGYKYFPIDNGKNSEKANNTFIKDDFQMGIFQHTLMENIFDSVGIKLAGNLFADPLYYNVLVNLPTDLSEFEQTNNDKRFTHQNGVQVAKSVYEPLRFNLNDTDTQWNGNTFTAESDIVTFDCAYSFLANRGNFYAGSYGYLEVRCNYTINGVPFTDERILTEADANLKGGIYSAQFTTENYSFSNVKIGDTFTFEIRNIATTPPTDGFWSSISQYEQRVQNVFRYDIIGANVPYSITNAIPEINQAKFAQDVMFRFGCISQFNAENRTLYIDKFDTIERNKSKGIDFTKKVDLSKDINIDFTKLLQKYFKTTYIKYAEDDKDLLSVLNRKRFAIGLGDGKIEINNDNLSDEGTIYESPFASTAQSWSFPYSGGYATSNFYLPKMSLFNASSEVNELKPRLFVNAGFLDINDINKIYGTIFFNGINEPKVGYAYFAKELLDAGSTANLNLNSNLDTLSFQHYEGEGNKFWGNTLLDKYYSLQNKILNAPIFLSINLKLDDLDIEKIDFLTPIWIETQIDSGYYYINEISQYKGDGSTTKVNLVKI